MRECLLLANHVGSGSAAVSRNACSWRQPKCVFVPPVVRQNSSRDPRRGGSWWSRQAVIGSIEQEDSGGGQPACAWSAHIYKGPVENRSGLGRSIMMVQPSESLLRKDSTRSLGSNSALRCPLLKSKMRTVFMLVTNV